MRNNTVVAQHALGVTELAAVDLDQVSGGEDRVCSGPTVCDSGHCEDAKGVCTMKAE